MEENFLESLINWENIDYSTFPYKNLLKYKEYIDWNNVSFHKKLTKEQIRELKEYLKWDILLQKYKFTIEEL